MCEALEGKPRATWDDAAEFCAEVDPEAKTTSGYLIDQGSVASTAARHAAERAHGVCKRRRVTPKQFDAYHAHDAVLLRRTLESAPVSYTHLRAHVTYANLVCRRLF